MNQNGPRAVAEGAPSLEEIEERLRAAKMLQEADVIAEIADNLLSRPGGDIVVGFPLDGAPDPVAAGTIKFDFLAGKVELPDNSASPQVRDLGVHGIDVIRSALIWCDDTIRYRFQPGFESLYHAGAAWFGVHFPKGTRGFEVTLSRAANIYIAFSSRPIPPAVAPFSSFQERYAAETLTKTAGAGTDDSLAALTFTALNDATELTPADAGAGDTVIHCTDWAHMSIVVEAGAAAIDVNIQTRHRASGSWVDDRSTLSAYRIDASQIKTFIIDRDAHFVRVRGRVAGMVAATTTSDVVVQYRARPHLGGSDDGVSAESHQIRPASGALTAAETGTPIIVPSWARKAVLRLDITTITTADGDDEVDWYVQTSYNRGADWADVANVHVANAENGNTELHLLTIDRAQTNVGVVTESDATLADDTRLNIPLGDRIRIRTAITGATAPTYAYNAEVLFLA